MARLDLTSPIDLSSARDLVDDLLDDVDLADVTERARELTGDGIDVVTDGSTRLARTVTTTVVPGTTRLVRRHPRPILGALVAVIAIVAIWRWRSGRKATDDASVTSIERAA